MKQLFHRFLLVVFSVIAGLLFFQLLGTKIRAQQCPAPCGQTWPGYYLCECTEKGTDPYTGEQDACLRRECAWENGCCSKCSESDCCSAPVGGGSQCGTGEPPPPGYTPPPPGPGVDPQCQSGCGYDGCPCPPVPDEPTDVPTKTPPEPCKLTLAPNRVYLSPGSSAQVTANIEWKGSRPNGTERLVFTPELKPGFGVFSVDPGEDNSEPYTTSLTGVEVGAVDKNPELRAEMVRPDNKPGRPDKVLCNRKIGVEITNNPPTPTPTPTPIDVTGRVFLDNDDSAGYTGFRKCIDPAGSATPFGPPQLGGSKVTVNPDGNFGAVLGGGNLGEYTAANIVSGVNKTLTLDLGSGAGTYRCTCPDVGCQYFGVSIDGNSNTNWNFYVSDILANWAQVVGGHVHGQTGAVVAVPAGNYFMIKSSVSNQPGAASKTSGNITTIPGSLSTTNWNLSDALSLSTWRYAYQRLWVRAGSPTADPGDGSRPPDNSATTIFRETGDFSVNGGGWQNLTGTRVIFVDGDVTINNKVTLADSGDFLAIIASGDINVNPAVGDAAVASPTSSNADLVGAFLADGNFNGGTTASQTDKQLVIYGTVGADIDLNGSGRVRFQRDMGVNNAVGPGVSVIWNPFLILNFPDQLSDALTDWREVAP